MTEQEQACALVETVAQIHSLLRRKRVPLETGLSALMTMLVNIHADHYTAADRNAACLDLSEQLARMASTMATGNVTKLSLN